MSQYVDRIDPDRLLEVTDAVEAVICDPLHITSLQSLLDTPSSAHPLLKAFSPLEIREAVAFLVRLGMVVLRGG
ncbi:MAG: hypothetical protein ACYTGR_11905 [Planctomycetota bacterium]|jgi:hypothetical protein